MREDGGDKTNIKEGWMSLMAVIKMMQLRKNIGEERTGTCYRITLASSF